MNKNRKWEKVLWIALILSVVILGVLLVVQIGNGIRDNDTEVPDQTQESTEETSAEESQTETEESQTEASGEQTSVGETETFEEGENGYIIIGDSHAVVTDGQGYSVYGSSVEGVALNKNLFIVHTGLDPVMGTIDWLEGDGTERIQEIIAGHTEISQWNIISIHGTSMVTIPDIAKRYISNYQDWMDNTFSGCQVYMVSVPPLDEEEWVIRHPDMPTRSNKDIVRFNTSIKEAFPDNYFDYYDWFLEHSDAFQDEIHYTGETYREMFDEVIGKIND